MNKKVIRIGLIAEGEAELGASIPYILTTLPPSEQDAIATMILEELEDEIRWDLLQVNYS